MSTEPPTYGLSLCAEVARPGTNGMNWDTGEEDCITRSLLIDFLRIEGKDHLQAEIDRLEGKDSDPYPDTFNSDFFEVDHVFGLTGRLAAMCRDIPGQGKNTWLDIAWCLQNIETNVCSSFLEWAESPMGSWWLPGYGVHAVEDVVEEFRAHRVLGLAQ